MANILKLYQERPYQRSYSTIQVHKNMSRCYNKDITMLVILVRTLKIFLSVEINLEIIEVVARSCSIKNALSKIWKTRRKKPLLDSL